VKKKLARFLMESPILRNAVLRWDIQLERDKPIAAMNTRTGKWRTVDREITRVKYRRAGSRGRFETFVVEGALPDDLQALVDKFEESRKPARPT
jgi:hypothetical protein